MVKPLTPSGWCENCAQTARERAALPALLVRFFGPEETRGPVLAAVAHHLLHERYPRNVYRWLHELHPRVTDAIAQLAAGTPLEAVVLRDLQSVPGGPMFVDSLRRVGLLPPMTVDVYLDGVMARLLTDLPPPRGLVLRAYCRFHLLQYVHLGSGLPVTQARALTIAKRFLVALDPCIEIAGLTQHTIDRYVKTLAPAQHLLLHRFVHWLSTTNRCRLRLRVLYGAALSRTIIGDRAFLAALHRARTDAELAPSLRVYVLLLILCAREPGELCALPASAIVRTGPSSIEVQFARGEAVPIDGPEADLIAGVAATSGTWLFPSPQRPKHLESGCMLRALRAAGITVQPRQLVRAALAMRCREIEAGEVRRSVGRRTVTGPLAVQTLDIAEREYLAAISQ